MREAREKGLPAFDPSLDTDEFFGKTARSLEKIEAERRRSGPDYLFLAPRLGTQDVSARLHSEEDYEFLVHYLHEAGLEHVSSPHLTCIFTSLPDTNWISRKSESDTRRASRYHC